LHLHCVFLRLHLSGQAEEVALPDAGLYLIINHHLYMRFFI
jgi:hypothetical protein